jgi:hypothetical protein
VKEKIKKGEDVAFDVDVAVNVGFADGGLVKRPEHSPQRAGMIENESEAGIVAGIRPADRAVPKADSKIPR